jgi:hypothetical protein
LERANALCHEKVQAQTEMVVVGAREAVCAVISREVWIGYDEGVVERLYARS